ncbi:protein-tyrosine phosphatase-like protein, partial [Pelagophyceae sp. CCMP2097]
MATRIKDGVFMADGETSQDAEFISLNKVGYIVNCAGRQLPNLWARQGVRYLTFPWDDAEDCALFDAHDARCCQLVSFIDEALRSGDSVVVHSHLGTGRCVAACAAYLMHKYEWGSDKAMRYVRSKRGDAQPNAGFLRQLRALDRRFQ